MKTKNENEFWLVVTDCLVKFHSLQQSQAEQYVRRFRDVLSEMTGSEFGLIYHEEPFSIACEIVGKMLDLTVYLPEYKLILKKREW